MPAASSGACPTCRLHRSRARRPRGSAWALGIAQWNFFGISYGTDYALTYMRLHPEGIRSVGIDGIFPPPIAGGVSTWQSAGEGINAIFAACNADPRCHERYGDIGATFRELVQKYEQNPETVKVSVPDVPDPVNVTISGFMLVQWAVSPGTHTAAEVPAAIDGLAHGDATRVATALGPFAAQSRQHRRLQQRALRRRLMRRVGAL